MRARSLFLIALLALPLALLAADPATFIVGAFTFKRPAAWAWVALPPGSMRKAQLRIPDPANPAGPGAEVAFFHFGAGQGGGVDQNISRWVGQFDHPETANPVLEKAEVKGTKITRIRVDHGTFNNTMSGGPATSLPDYGLYGAILESPQGDVFIKMTGPAALVKAAAADFEGLIQSPF